LWLWLESSEIMQFQISIVKICWALTHCMNVSYVIVMSEKEVFGFSMLCLLWVLIIFFVAMWKVVRIIKEYYLEHFFPFQNIHANIRIHLFSKIMTGALPWNQQDNSSGHLINLCRQLTAIYCMTAWIPSNKIIHVQIIPKIE
jgi:ABC-type multidrug transport system fused ATPase/permease subunit